MCSFLRALTIESVFIKHSTELSKLPTKDQVAFASMLEAIINSGQAIKEETRMQAFRPDWDLYSTTLI